MVYLFVSCQKPNKQLLEETIPSFLLVNSEEGNEPDLPMNFQNWKVEIDVFYFRFQMSRLSSGIEGQIWLSQIYESGM